MNKTSNTYSTARDSYLYGHGWSLKSCPVCSGKYFTKRNLGNCGSLECAGRYEFLQINPPGYLLELNTLTGLMAPFFSEHSFNPTPSISVFRKSERTLFASAAGQVFDPAIYNGKQPDDTRLFIIQPVIRLQNSELVGQVEGCSTSFLNAATELWQATPADHMNALDAWFDFFSTQGFYVGNLSLAVGRETENWNGIALEADSLRLNYGGLEVAIANFFHSIPDQDNAASLSDISVGVERLVWAINKVGSYFDAIGPLYEALWGRFEAMDAIRTLTLMASAGVEAGHKNHGYQFRALAKSRNRVLRDSAIREMVTFYYSQWTGFVNPICDLHIVEREVAQEIDRNANIEVCDLLGINAECDQTREVFLRTIVRKRIATPDVLRKAIRKRDIE